MTRSATLLVAGRNGCYGLTARLAEHEMRGLPVVGVTESSNVTSGDCIINPPFAQALSALGLKPLDAALFVKACTRWDHYEEYYGVPNNNQRDDEAQGVTRAFVDITEYGPHIMGYNVYRGVVSVDFVEYLLGEPLTQAVGNQEKEASGTDAWWQMLSPADVSEIDSIP